MWTKTTKNAQILKRMFLDYSKVGCRFPVCAIRRHHEPLSIPPTPPTHTHTFWLRLCTFIPRPSARIIFASSGKESDECRRFAHWTSQQRTSEQGEKCTRWSVAGSTIYRPHTCFSRYLHGLDTQTRKKSKAKIARDWGRCWDTFVADLWLRVIMWWNRVQLLHWGNVHFPGVERV